MMDSIYLTWVKTVEIPIWCARNTCLSLKKELRFTLIVVFITAFKPNFDKHPLPSGTLAPLGGDLVIPCMVEAAPVPEVT